jgi:DNA-binding transcriptional LysR family regulator
MLDIRRMRVLREVAARGSFSGAAEALSYTQSAVSQHVAALERETGAQLIERRPRALRLTDAGQVLVRHTEAILARLAEAQAELEAIAGLRAGHVRLAAFPSAGATLVPAAVAIFRERHPDVEIELAMAEPVDGAAGVRAGDYDLALSIADSVSHINEGLEAVHLLDDGLHVALPLHHPLAGRAQLRLTDLREATWLLGSTGVCPDRYVFLDACHRAGFDPDVMLQSDDYNAIQGFVASGVGVALVPELALVNVREDIVVRPLAGRPVFREIVAVATGGSAAAPATGAMLDALREAAASFRTGRDALMAVA